MKFPMNEHSINQFWNSTNTVVTVTVVTNISISRSYYENNEKWYIYFYLTFIYINKPKKYPSWYKTRYKEKLLLAWIKNRNLHPEFIHTFMETWFQVSASHCPSIWKRYSHTNLTILCIWKRCNENPFGDTYLFLIHSVDTTG